jgi:APA family basic amino acid/polyamine antiporter
MNTITITPIITGKILAVTVILTFTLIHYRGIKYGAKIQNALTFLKIGLILILLISGFLSGEGNFNHFNQGSRIASGISGWQTIGLSLMWIMFAYSGWNASTYLGAEIKNPSKVLPLSLLSGTGIVIVLYLGINILYVYGINPEDMKGVISVGGLAMGNLFGRSADIIFSLMIAVALFSSLSAFIIIGPRIYYSMASDGLFFKSVAKIHHRFKVPSNSILLQGVLSIVLVISGTFEQVLTYMGFALGIFPILTVLTLFKLRKKKTGSLRFSGFPVTQFIFIAAGILILGLSWLEKPLESSIAILTILTGIPVYFYFKKRKFFSKYKNGTILIQEP